MQKYFTLQLKMRNRLNTFIKHMMFYIECGFLDTVIHGRN